MRLKPHLVYGQHTLDTIVLNGAFWFSENDLGPCFGMTSEQMGGVYQQAIKDLTADMTRVFEVEQPDGEVELSRIFSQQGVHILATQAESPKVTRFVRWLDDALYGHRLHSLGGYNHTAEERLMRAIKGLQGVISLMSASTTHQFAIDNYGIAGLATVLDLIHSELQGVIPAVRDR